MPTRDGEVACTGKLSTQEGDDNDACESEPSLVFIMKYVMRSSLKTKQMPTQAPQNDYSLK